MKLLPYFNPETHEIYDLLEDETPRDNEIPLKKKPNPSCKRCHGTLVQGTNTLTGKPVFCTRCIRRYADFDKMNLTEAKNSSIPV